jgi:hypothetical protein
MTWLLALVLKPFVAFLFFATAYVVARGLARLIPNGRIKDALYDRTLQKRYPWRFALLAMASIWGVVALVALVSR